MPFNMLVDATKYVFSSQLTSAEERSINHETKHTLECSLGLWSLENPEGSSDGFDGGEPPALILGAKVVSGPGPRR